MSSLAWFPLSEHRLTRDETAASQPAASSHCFSNQPATSQAATTPPASPERETNTQTRLFRWAIRLQ